MNINRNEILIDEIEELINDDIQKLDLEIVDIEYVQDGSYKYLRIYIERYEDEITLDDCAKLSNLIENKIDELIEEKFFLEVSSPGLERRLRKETDFIRFRGKKIKILLKQKIDGYRNLEAIILDFSGGVLYINLLEENKKLEIPFTNIKKANLVFEFQNINFNDM